MVQLRKRSEQRVLSRRERLSQWIFNCWNRTQCNLNSVIYIATRGTIGNADEYGQSDDTKYEDPIWVAIKSCSLESVMALVEEDSTCLNIRGDVGETPLHWCFLYYHPKHREIARWLLDRYPELAEDVYDSELYQGENILHMAIMHHDFQMAQHLVKSAPHLVHGRAVGRFFKLNEASYYGESPLFFAACSDQKEMVDLLLDNGAILRARDAYGNSVFHLLVHYQLQGMYSYLLTKWNAADGEPAKLLNKEKLSPVTLAAKLGHRKMLEYLLSEDDEFEEWRYGQLALYLYPLDEVDYIAGKKDTDRPTVIQLLVQEGHAELLQMPRIHSVLTHKWAKSLRRQFFQRLIIAIFYAVLFTVAMVLDNSDWWLANIVANLCELGLGAHAVEQWWLAIRNLFKFGPVGFFTAKGSLFLGNITTLTFGACFLTAFMMRILGAQGWLVSLLLSVAGGSLWFHLLFYMLGFRLTGPFIIMIAEMIQRDLSRFLSIYAVFSMAFSSSFTALCGPTGPSGFMKRLELSILMLVGHYDFGEGCEKGARGGTAVILMFLNALLVSVLLINLLVAMMGSTYERISNAADARWLLEWSRIMTALQHELGDSQCDIYWQEIDGERYIRSSEKNVGKCSQWMAPEKRAPTKKKVLKLSHLVMKLIRSGALSRKSDLHSSSEEDVGVRRYSSSGPPAPQRALTLQPSVGTFFPKCTQEVISTLPVTRRFSFSSSSIPYGAKYLSPQAALFETKSPPRWSGDANSASLVTQLASRSRPSSPPPHHEGCHKSRKPSSVDQGTQADDGPYPPLSSGIPSFCGSVVSWGNTDVTRDTVRSRTRHLEEPLHTDASCSDMHASFSLPTSSGCSFPGSPTSRSRANSRHNNIPHFPRGTANQTRVDKCHVPRGRNSAQKLADPGQTMSLSPQEQREKHAKTPSPGKLSANGSHFDDDQTLSPLSPSSPCSSVRRYSDGVQSLIRIPGDLPPYSSPALTTDFATPEDFDLDFGPGLMEMRFITNSSKLESAAMTNNPSVDISETPDAPDTSEVAGDTSEVTILTDDKKLNDTSRVKPYDLSWRFSVLGVEDLPSPSCTPSGSAALPSPVPSRLPTYTEVLHEMGIVPSAITIPQSTHWSKWYDRSTDTAHSNSVGSAAFPGCASVVGSARLTHSHAFDAPIIPDPSFKYSANTPWEPELHLSDYNGSFTGSQVKGSEYSRSGHLSPSLSDLSSNRSSHSTHYSHLASAPHMYRGPSLFTSPKRHQMPAKLTQQTLKPVVASYP